MSDDKKNTIAEQIRADFKHLTHSERQLANVLLANYPMAGLSSITIFAKDAGVSTPTVLRMIKKLGFSGFPEFQEVLRAELTETLSNPIIKHDRWATDAPETHILNKFADATIDNLHQSIKQIDYKIFDQVSALLADPERAVHIIGGRITHAIADYLHTHLQVIRRDVNLIAATAWPHYVLDMSDGDVLVIFDIRRYEQNVLPLAEIANTKNVQIVLFTDQWGSPVAKHASHSIHARIEAPSAWDSSVVTLFVIEALIAAVQTATWKESRDRMKSLEQLIGKSKMFKKFS